MARKALTAQQQRVLQFVEDFIRQRGFPPTLREIGQALGLPNVNAVRGHVAALERKGYLTRTPEKARSIAVVTAPSALSRLKRRLHEVLRTDEGVLHRVVYGLAWTTWRRRAFLAGRAGQLLAEAFEREMLEHGWQGSELRVEPDHVVVVVATRPNHSAELTVRRFQAAGRALKRRRRGEFPAGRLWGKGYVATTDLELLQPLVAQLLEQQPAGQGPAG